MARNLIHRQQGIMRFAKGVLVVGALSIAAGAYQFYGTLMSGVGSSTLSTKVVEAKTPRDDTGARKAFLAAYPVFMHPRCMNCHPVEDRPLQGDDSHPHAMLVKRGPDGRGKFAMKCGNCHQTMNLSGAHMPPGAPNWHLPPPEMRMVFEGKTPGELCRLLKDPRQNGGKTIEQLIHHVSEDKLVLWGWNPGDGRMPPPSHAEFARNMREWADKGATCPE